MKLKYIGQAGTRDLDLAIAGIIKPNDILLPDTIIEVPDDEELLIRRLKMTGNYIPVKKKPKIVKKEKKENKEE